MDNEDEDVFGGGSFPTDDDTDLALDDDLDVAGSMKFDEEADEDPEDRYH